MKVYHLDSIDYIKNSVPKEIFNDFKQVQVSWGNGKYYDAFTFTTVLIEGDIFLKELFNECKKQGVNFVNKHLNDEGEVTELPHDYIFNCAGIHSGKLFNDKNVYPIKGQLAVFRHTKGVDYYLSAPGPNGSRVTVYPHSTGTACGITHERDVWDQRPTLSICSVVAKNAQDFFKDKAVQPRAFYQLNNTLNGQQKIYIEVGSLKRKSGSGRIPTKATYKNIKRIIKNFKNKKDGFSQRIRKFQILIRLYLKNSQQENSFEMLQRDPQEAINKSYLCQTKITKVSFYGLKKHQSAMLTFNFQKSEK